MNMTYTTLLSIDHINIWGYPMSFWECVTIILILYILKKLGAPTTEQQRKMYENPKGLSAPPSDASLPTDALTDHSPHVTRVKASKS